MTARYWGGGGKILCFFSFNLDLKVGIETREEVCTAACTVPLMQRSVPWYKGTKCILLTANTFLQTKEF